MLVGVLGSDVALVRVVTLEVNLEAVHETSEGSLGGEGSLVGRVELKLVELEAISRVPLHGDGVAQLGTGLAVASAGAGEGLHSSKDSEVEGKSIIG